MNIAIIGAGNVGGTLALAFRKAGHSVIFGVRDKDADFKGLKLAIDNGISWFNIDEAVEKSEVVVISTPAQYAADIARQLGDLKGKIIIDTMNSAFLQPSGYTNTADAILANSNATDLVKCFNTTGFENMANPRYGDVLLDMFVAGSSKAAKEAATQLAKDIGFGEVYDFGGNETFQLIEQFALCWINLAIIQKHGRDLAFKLIRRP
jgi:hypothetical protein